MVAVMNTNDTSCRAHAAAVALAGLRGARGRAAFAGRAPRRGQSAVLGPSSDASGRSTNQPQPFNKETRPMFFKDRDDTSAAEKDLAGLERRKVSLEQRARDAAAACETAIARRRALWLDGDVADSKAMTAANAAVRDAE